MRIIFILLLAASLSCLLLWAGAFKLLQKKMAALLAALSLLVAGSLLLLAVLPGNSFYGPVLTKVDTRAKVIALTFDDGPYPPYTQKLLQVLKDKNVHATFFMVGDNIAKQPDVARLVQAQGHEIALHAGHHKDLLKLTQTELQENITYGKQVLQKELGVTPKLMRPPHGFKDWQVANTIQANGLRITNWSIIPRDWTNPGAQVIADRVISKAEPGAIVLLHDGDSPKMVAPRDQTVAAVGIIIDTLRQQGYKFVTVSELLKLQNK